MRYVQWLGLFDGHAGCAEGNADIERIFRTVCRQAHAVIGGLASFAIEAKPFIANK